MPFCPKCRFEYEPNVSVCPDCEEKLVAALPPLDEGEDLSDETMDWVHLGRLTSREYAQMLAGVLQSRGIPNVIRSGVGFFGVTGQMGVSSYSAAGGGYSVFVPEEFVVAADVEATAVLGETWKKARLVDVEGAESADEAGEPEEPEEPEESEEEH
ncbi:MAG TPA: hypothetical protein PKM43_12595 [Verrucomicrobiota bacterium]|nr:hypothetical protein [candidate division Zixibacteria bacterium]MDD4918734.1 hypothetical protein [candidate division Zixibacteria bacterium]HOB99574.1 hypothetical protein [Verrucomicrobiota bacterium]HOY57802.1 hypothetical protein [Verrucomicrobiota bacterium]HPM38558.1 hypothetical protein [candidate division Zixibacteria bacterium]